MQLTSSKERQREGISIAKAKGKYRGKQSKFSDADVARIRDEFKNCDNKQKLADRYGITRGYLYELVKDRGSEPKT